MAFPSGINQTGVYRVKGQTRNNILVNETNQAAFSIVLSGASGHYEEVNGRHVVRAGTPVAGDLENRNTPFVTTADVAIVVGIVLHDVEITDGEDKNSQVLIHGFVDVNKLDEHALALLTPEIRSAWGMRQIAFVSDN